MTEEDKSGQSQSPGRRSSSNQTHRNEALEVHQDYATDVADVEGICREVAKRDFEDLADLAMHVAIERADALVDGVISRFSTDPLALSGPVGDPDFQWGLAQAKVAYARSGDPSQRDLLVELLDQRVRHPQRTTAQILLSESLAVVGKLTRAEIAATALIYKVRYQRQEDLCTQGELRDFLVQQVAPLAVRSADASPPMLELFGCGWSSRHVIARWTGLVDVLVTDYYEAFTRIVPTETYCRIESAVGGKIAELIARPPSSSGRPARSRRLPHQSLMEIVDAADEGLETVSWDSRPPVGAMSEIRRSALWAVAAEQPRFAIDQMIELCGDSVDPDRFTQALLLLSDFELSPVGAVIGQAEARRATGERSSMEGHLEIDELLRGPMRED